MMVQVVLRIRNVAGDLQGLKETIAADFEKFGNVEILEVSALPDEDRQIQMKGVR